MPKKKRAKSVLKNVRKSRHRYLENLAKKKKLKSVLKAIKKAKSKTDALKKYPEIQSIIDKSIQDGIIKKNTAARYKSHVWKYIKTLVG